MSHGEVDVIYLVHSVKGNKPVLVLNTGHLPFSKLSRTIQSGMEGYYSFHNIQTPHRLIALSDHSPGIIRAVSVETGEKIWEVIGEVDGRMIQPHSLVFSPQQQVLLVPDGWNSRVLVLHRGMVHIYKQYNLIRTWATSLTCVSIKTNLSCGTMLKVKYKCLISPSIRNYLNHLCAINILDFLILTFLL